jgi:hypothetical protein
VGHTAQAAIPSAISAVNPSLRCPVVHTLTESIHEYAHYKAFLVRKLCKFVEVLADPAIKTVSLKLHNEAVKLCIHIMYSFWGKLALPSSLMAGAAVH